METSDDQVAREYAQDYFTVPSNIVGAPALVIPYGREERSGLKSSLKLWGEFGKDYKLLAAAREIDSLLKN